MMGLEEIWSWSWTTSTLEVVGMNDLSSGWFKDLKVALFSCNSFLWSWDSSWRNSMVSCVCCRCSEISQQEFLCWRAPCLHHWRWSNCEECLTIEYVAPCLLEVRLACRRCRTLNYFTWRTSSLECDLNGTLAWFVVDCTCKIFSLKLWNSHLLDDDRICLSAHLTCLMYSHSLEGIATLAWCRFQLDWFYLFDDYCNKLHSSSLDVFIFALN